jgi:hypothetical protein
MPIKYTTHRSPHHLQLRSGQTYKQWSLFIRYLNYKSFVGPLLLAIYNRNRRRQSYTSLQGNEQVEIFVVIREIDIEIVQNIHERVFVGVFLCESRFRDFACG